MAAKMGCEQRKWIVDGEPMDYVGLWRLAHAAGYNPIPFCDFKTTDAAKVLCIGHEIN